MGTRTAHLAHGTDSGVIKMFSRPFETKQRKTLLLRDNGCSFDVALFFLIAITTVTAAQRLGVCSVSSFDKQPLRATQRG